MLARIARFSVRHRRLVAAAWAVLFVAGIVIGGGVFERLDPDVGDVEGTESARAEARLDALDPGGETIAAVADGVDPRDPVVAAHIRATVRRLRAIPGVAEVADPVTGDAPELVAGDGRAVLVAVELAPGLDGERFDQALEAAEAELRRLDAPRVLVGGGPLQDEEFEDQVGADLARAELLSMPVVLVLLLVVFGGIVAAGLPVLVALVGVAGTLLALLGISSVTEVSVYSVNVVTMLGLGLAVDYALLLVSRFREERATRDLPAAIEAAAATAGRTVVFSGLTVAASLAGLLVFADPFLRSMAYGGGAVVLIDLLAAITLLPALLAMWGRRIRPDPRGTRPDPRGTRPDPRGTRPDPRGTRPDPRGTRPVRRRVPRWGSVAEAARGRSRLSTALVVVAVAVPLAVAATPFLRVRYQQPDASFLPGGAESREPGETLQARFAPAVWVEPVAVLADAGADRAGLADLADQVAALEGVRAVAEPRGLGGGVHVLEVLPEGSGTDAAASRLVAGIRSLPAPFAVQVTGDAAALADYQATIRERLPLAAALVVLATFVLLFLFTGSVVVPAKAIVMNVLSLGASFGALVWVFQDGNLA
jgi:RND superfamily putative drug exporter